MTHENRERGEVEGHPTGKLEGVRSYCQNITYRGFRRRLVLGVETESLRTTMAQQQTDTLRTRKDRVCQEVNKVGSDALPKRRRTRGCFQLEQ
jgi:hypothetical protein